MYFIVVVGDLPTASGLSWTWGLNVQWVLEMDPQATSGDVSIAGKAVYQ